MFHRGEKSSMMLMGKRKNGEEWGDAARSLAVLLNSSSIDENAENRTRPPRNLHLCLANAAQGDIVVTMKPPSPRCSPSHPSIHTPTQRCHVRVSHSNFCLEPDARNFANSDHAYITARLTKKILSAFFHRIFFLPFLPPFSFSISFFFSSLFFFLVLVFELSLRTPDNAKILLKQTLA